MLKITKNAEEYLEKWAQKNKITSPAFRVMMQGFGWGGPNLALVQADAKDKEKGREHTFNNTRIIWDKQLDGIAKQSGTMIVDYSSGFMGVGLTVTFNGSNYSC